MNKPLILTGILVAGVVAAGIWYTQFSQQKITLSDVSLHATSQDCWMVINGNVYDVTAYIATRNHPGGSAILEGCGKDATTIFEQRPEDRRPHSSTAHEELQQFFIGTLSQ